MFKNMWSKFMRKLVQPDPKPQPSILDILDSRGTVPLDDDEADRIAEIRRNYGDIPAHYARLAEIQKRAALS